jgi:hypothetical protein
MLVQQVIISYVDLQWSNYRTMIATGVLFALISRLAVLGGADARAHDRPASGADGTRNVTSPVLLHGQG